MLQPTTVKTSTREVKKRWKLVFVGDAFFVTATLRKAVTLEDARHIAVSDEVSREMGKYTKFKGILNVDITNQDLKAMGF